MFVTAETGGYPQLRLLQDCGKNKSCPKFSRASAIDRREQP